MPAPTSSMHTPNRRRLLQLAGASSLLAWGPGAQALEHCTGNCSAQDEYRALSRLGYGPTTDTMAAVQSLGAQRWALQQVHAARQASQLPPALPADYAHIDQALPQLFEGARREREARAQRKERVEEPAARPGRLEQLNNRDPLYFSRAQAQGAAAWRLLSCSNPAVENPLLARMTEFWFNHFNVYVGKGAVRPFVGHYLIHVARAHALGKFEDLLLASARHPAMLHYLDQWQSVAEGSRGADGRNRGLNENYARELMELHTLGVHGGYTQKDVRELARILTGWTIGPQSDSGFRFAPRMHDTGSKTVLGVRYGGLSLGGGEQEGVDAIRALVRHPSTAQRVCLRLAKFLVADTPRPGLVMQMVRTFSDTGGDMAQVVHTVLQSEDFWAPDNRLFKTPMDFTCSVLAATQAFDDPRALLQTAAFLAQAGQPLHGWQTPDGYAFDAATWRVPEALTRRADFALLLARQRDTRYLLPYLSERTAQTIAHEAPALQSGLILASPEFQWK